MCDWERARRQVLREVRLAALGSGDGAARGPQRDLSARGMALREIAREIRARLIAERSGSRRQRCRRSAVITATAFFAKLRHVSASLFGYRSARSWWRCTTSSVERGDMTRQKACYS